MARINIVVVGTVHAPLESVRAELLDCACFGQWWPLRVDSLDRDTPTVAVRPLPFVAIHMVRRLPPEQHCICYDYVRGPFRGHGTWLLRAIEHGTEVNYTIDLTPTNWLFALVARTPFFRIKHCWDIRRIIERLGQRLLLKR